MPCITAAKACYLFVRLCCVYGMAEHYLQSMILRNSLWVKQAADHMFQDASVMVYGPCF